MKITPVNDQVHLVTGTNVNWYVVADGDAVTLVDAGYPNDSKALFASLEELGRRPEDVQAIALTHAHLDHMGGVPAFRAMHEVPVLTGEEEVRHTRRDYLEQITPVQMLQQCSYGAGRRWVAQTLRAVVPHLSMAVLDATAVPADAPVDIPGGLVPVPTPGHTKGHTAWLMPSTGTVFTGDALVTGHPISRLGDGPQLLPSVFNHDEAAMRASLETIAALPADTIAPGHGEHVRGDLPALVGQALDRPPTA